jgi:hypothetical protein
MLDISYEFSTYLSSLPSIKKCEAYRLNLLQTPYHAVHVGFELLHLEHEVQVL